MVYATHPQIIRATTTAVGADCCADLDNSVSVKLERQRLVHVPLQIRSSLRHLALLCEVLSEMSAIGRGGMAERVWGGRS